MAADGIAAFLDALAARQLEAHSFMMLRHGQVIAEGWWRPYAADLPHMLFSLSKSFTSTAVGLAIHEGRLSVEDPVTSFFPDDLPASVGPNLAAMRVRHLLTMGTGHDKDTTGRLREADGGRWTRAFLHLDVEHAPGSKFVYNSGATYMLSAIVQKVTGASLLDYLQPRLLQPLGIEGATWESSPEGVNTGGWGLSVKTEDIARFGQLYLQKGRWQGRQLVPEAWVDAATAPQIDNAPAGNIDWAQGYGYQFWRCQHGAYRGDGAFGQFCVVLPAQDAVIAITSGIGNMQGVLDCAWEFLLPAMAAGGDAAQDARLRGRLDQLALSPTLSAAPPARWTPVSGRRYVFAPNPAELESLTLDLGESACRVSLARRGETTAVDCGFDQWRRTSGAEPCAGRAGWDEDGALVLSWYRVTTPFGHTLRISADGAGVLVRYRSNVGPDAKGHEVRGA